MARQIVWTAAAEGDLQEIERYLRAVDPDNADRVLERLEDAPQRCLNPHFRGSRAPEVPDPALRQIRAMSWRILYRIEADRIRVGLVHVRRLLGNVGHGFEENPQEGYVAA